MTADPDRPHRPRSDKAKSELAAWLAPRLEALYPDLEISLDWSDPLQLAVATILSAQCTDERVNQVTKTLFPKYPDARAYAAAELEELEQDVRPTGFFRNKARHLKGLGRRLIEEFDGQVPRTMDELLTLPGVARKTANVILSNAFDTHVGIVVDTHVKRVAHRLGLTGSTDPPKVERDLMKILPREWWRSFPWRLILHGRNVCHARTPACGVCDFFPRCPSRIAPEGG